NEHDIAARELAVGGTQVLIYHCLGVVVRADVDDREGKYWVSPASFVRLLAMLREGGYRVVPLYDFWTDDGDERLGRPPVVLTFDDGRATDYEIAFPLLLAAGVGAEFFLNTATIGQPGHLTWDQVVEMPRPGLSFQAHP